LNILFVLYHHFTANSAAPTAAFAKELRRLGHECCIAVPERKQTVSRLGPTDFLTMEFSELSALSSLFSNGNGPDIVHAWTPREMVRIFSEAVVERFHCRLFVHLEDNEWSILSSVLNRDFKELAALPSEELDSLISPHLSHPRRAFDFMSRADGVTIIIDRLAELVPDEIPTVEIWPSADTALFYPQPRQEHQRNAVGIPVNSTVIAYTGNVHSANYHEMRSLYLAVAILNREGFPITLVRAGRDFYPFLGPEEQWARCHSIELGLLPYFEIRSVLALADILVQPGKADAFNDYRFPSKLPEFLSIGRPVILPNSNIGRHMVHRKHAYLLDDPNAVVIASAIREISSDPELYATLSAGSVEFFQERLSWSQSALRMNDFYASACASPRRT